MWVSLRSGRGSVKSQKKMSFFANYVCTLEAQQLTGQPATGSRLAFQQNEQIRVFPVEGPLGVTLSHCRPSWGHRLLACRHSPGSSQTGGGGRSHFQFLSWLYLKRVTTVS